MKQNSPIFYLTFIIIFSKILKDNKKHKLHIDSISGKKNLVKEKTRIYTAYHFYLSILLKYLKGFVTIA